MERQAYFVIDREETETHPSPEDWESSADGMISSGSAAMDEVAVPGMSARRLRWCLRVLGWSIRDLARRLFLTETTVCQMAWDRSTISDEIAIWLEGRVAAARLLRPAPAPRRRRLRPVQHPAIIGAGREFAVDRRGGLRDGAFVLRLFLNGREQMSEPYSAEPNTEALNQAYQRAVARGWLWVNRGK